MAKDAQTKINFTKTTLDGLPLPPSRKRFFFYDTKGNGLHIAVTSQGQKTFYIRRRINGKNEKHCLGSFPDLSVEQARDKAARFAGAVAFGDNPAEQRRLLRGEISLGELFQEYMARHLVKSRKSSAETQKCFERFFGDWKERKLTMITQADVEKRHAELGRDRGFYSANRAHELLRALFNKAKSWRLYQGLNPAIGITPFEERSRERVLQADEFEGFFAALENEEETFRDFVMLTLLTGARKSNVLSMRWENLNLKSGSWTISAEQSKNSQSQFIVLTEAEMEILKRREQSDFKHETFVFPSNSKPGHLTDVKHSWASFLKRADINGLHIHDLRRSLASWMASTGANVAVIRSALHHKDMKTTLTVYARANRQAELAARELAHRTMLDLGRSQSVVPMKRKSNKIVF
jgi:integrase